MSLTAEKPLILSKASKRAMTHLSLEGIELSPEALADVKLMDAGKITKDELFKRAVKRATS